MTVTALYQNSHYIDAYYSEGLVYRNVPVFLMKILWLANQMHLIGRKNNGVKVIVHSIRYFCVQF